MYILQTRILGSKSTVKTTTESELFRNLTECVISTWIHTVLTSLPTTDCLKSPIETLEKCVKHVQS